MLYLLFCILLNTTVFVQFRWLGVRGLPLLPVITINYAVCLVLTLVWAFGVQDMAWPAAGPWLVLGVIQGILFVTVFRLIAQGAVQLGVGASAILTKLSLVVPVAASLVLFGETLGGWQWLGVALVLLALALQWPQGQMSAARIPLMAGIFIGAGVVDTNMKLYAGWFGQVPVLAFLSVVFLLAALGGVVRLRVARHEGGRLTAPVWGAGLLLGVINWGCVITLMLALEQVPGSVLYPVNNIGQLVLAGIAGMLLFAERPSQRTWIAYAVAVLGIVLLV